MPPPRPTPRQPTRRLTLAVLVVATIAVVVLAWSLVQREYRAQQTYWSSRVTTAAELRVELLETWWRERHGDTRALGSSPAVQQFLGATGPARLRLQAELDAWLRTVAESYGYTAIYLLDSAGRPLASSHAQTPLDPGIAADLAVAGRAGRPRLLVLGSDAAVARLALGAPVHRLTGGTPVALTVLVIDPTDELYPLVTYRLPGTASGEALLVRATDGNVAVFTPTLAEGQGFVVAPRASATASAAAVRGEQGFGRYDDYRGVPVLAATERDSLSGWGIVVKVDSAEAFADSRRYARFTAAIAFVLVGVLWSGGALLWQSRERADLARRLEAERLRVQTVELDRRAARLARLVDGATDELYAFDAEHLGFELVNRTALDQLGYSFAELQQMTPLDLAPQLDAAEFRSRLARLREGKAAEVRLETVHRARAGAEYPVELRIRYWPEGERPLFVAVATDVSERRSLEEQLRQSQKMEAVGQLAGGVAHDFNNILTAILGSAEFAIRGLGEGRTAETEVHQIREAAERARALTRQLLAFGRRQILQPVVVQLSAVVRDSLPLLERLIGEDIEVRVRPAPDEGHVRVDPAQFERVLANLIVNARDAMPQGGRITIETDNVELDEDYARTHPEAEPGSYVLLAVSDTGVGMDAATRNRIFEPFFSTKERGTGSGLGLATVYGVVRQSGGHIWVYSEVGHGATFKIYVPRVAPSEVPLGVATRPAPAAASVEPGGGETVLVVEDDADVRRVVLRCLASLGYEVLSAATPDEAVALVGTYAGPIHLVFTDVVLPGMSGRALAGRLVAERPDLRVLYTSGFTEDAVVRRGVLTARIAFLGKPFTPADLAAAVRRALADPGPAS